MNLSDDNLHVAIRKIYAAAAGEEDWRSALEYCSEMLGARSGQAIATETSYGENTFNQHHGLDPGARWEPYVEHYRHVDVWALAGYQLRAAKPWLTVTSSNEVVGESAYLRSEIHNEFHRPLGIARFMTSEVARPDGSGIRVSFFRDVVDTEFSPVCTRALDVLGRHFTFAVDLHERRLKVAGVALHALRIVDDSKDAVVLVDRHGNLSHINLTARHLLSECDLLVGKPGHIRLAQTLAESIALAVKNSGVDRVINTKGGAILVQFRNYPFVQGLSGGAPGPFTMVLMRRLEATSLDAAWDGVRSAFRLTAAELKLLMLIVEGYTIATASLRLGISRETARSQIKSVYQKTGHSHQHQLVSMIASRFVSAVRV